MEIVEVVGQKRPHSFGNFVLTKAGGTPRPCKHQYMILLPFLLLKNFDSVSQKKKAPEYWVFRHYDSRREIVIAQNTTGAITPTLPLHAPAQTSAVSSFVAAFRA